MNNQFGETIRNLRVSQRLFLRQAAASLEMDIALLSKIEKRQRQLKKAQVPELATILNAYTKELQSLWLFDQLYNMVQDEPMAGEALKSVSKNINSKKSK